ncbi:sensor histidine kinase [Cohnella massiliensis]|uniref:sensor histidine kinase n=1 Tax=Cohnella massiliensis TaxID=1816691 RepID=UPI0009BA0BC4|nr:ATP-binding protein [Cohnella massiliensis]
MSKKLSFRISVLLMLWSGAILVVASIAIVNATHFHFQLYGQEAAHSQSNGMLNKHLEQAIIQSVMLTIVFSIILAGLLSVYVARRISSPLVKMKQAALAISHGDLKTRVRSTNKDEMSELGQALNYLAEQLQYQQDLRTAMSENIAHELRTPLTTLKSFLSAMKDGIWEPTTERLESCQDEINRLIHLVHDLEQLNELSSPDFLLQRTNFSLRDHIDKIVQLNQAAFMEKSIHFSIDDIPDIQVSWDESRMIQVWNNLLSNALKFTDVGGYVRIYAHKREERVTLAIEDSGIGIPTREIPHVFERFYRTDKSRSRQSGGSGLGLSIAKSIVEAHSGQIWAHNKGSEGGTIVYVQLPINAI